MMRDNIGDHLDEDIDPEQIPIVDPHSPDLNEGKRDNPEDTTLTPEPQGEFDNGGAGVHQ